MSGMLARAPVMTGREIGLWLADEQEGRHWLTTCWCNARHDGGETGLTFVAWPWDESRDGESAG